MKGLPEVGPDEVLLPASGQRVTPSCVNVWRASRHPDQRYTYAQLARCSEWGVDAETCEDVIVRSTASMSEIYWDRWTQKAPTYLLPCPLLERRGDGSQCLVISPYGTKEWVYSDGSITKGRQIGSRRRVNFAGPRS